MAQTATIGALALQMARLADEQRELRALVMDVLKEMLRISGMQAEATMTMLRIAEEQQKQIAFQNAVGPGSSRDLTEEGDFQNWRQEIEARRQADAAAPDPERDF